MHCSRRLIIAITISPSRFGKSTPDQYAAIIKRHWNQALKSKQDVDSPEKMAKASVLFDGVANLLVFLGGVKKEDPDRLGEIPNLSFYRKKGPL